MTRPPFFSSGRLPALLAIAALVFTPGCSIPIPPAAKDPTRYYVLSTTGAGADAAPRGAAPAVHLRQVEIASYLASRPIIVRRGDHEIEFREYARWGESLELGVSRVLREELLARGAARAVMIPGSRRENVGYDYALSVRVLACEGDTAGSVLFRAVWELSRMGENGAPVAGGDFRAANLRWDTRTESSLAAQLSQAVAGLAAEIAGALRR